MARTRRIDRRTALKGLGALAASPLLARCGGAPEAPPLHTRIDTVVFLMLENRSFDHYLGALSLEEGRTDVDGLTAGMSNPDLEGRPVLVAPADASCVLDPGHNWNASRRQFNDGRNDGFVREHVTRYGMSEAHRVMGYHGRAELPAFYGLADHYTICQRWFSSVMAGTWPNRFYSLSGQSGGVKTNDRDVRYAFPAIYDRLERAGVSWGVYYGNVSFSWLYDKTYDPERFYTHERFFEDAAAGTLPNFTMLEPLYGRNDDHPPEHPLAAQVLVASIYQALARSPQWDRLLFVVSYDEHGGFFDHVPPPKAKDALASQGFDQLGFRVPSLAIGPYVRERHVCSTVYDHTSVLAFVNRLFGLSPLTERVEAATSLEELLDAERLVAGAPRAAPALPIIEADEEVIYAPECRYQVGLARPIITGQPELEDFLELHPGRFADRRHLTSKLYDDFLRHAEKSGVLALRSSGW